MDMRDIKMKYRVVITLHDSGKQLEIFTNDNVDEIGSFHYNSVVVQGYTKDGKVEKISVPREEIAAIEVVEL